MFIGLFLLKNKHEILVIIRLNEFWRLQKDFLRYILMNLNGIILPVKLHKFLHLPENEVNKNSRENL